MAIIWELDFYSRPLLDDNQKKVWEILLIQSPTNVTDDPATLFKFSKFCSNQSVNSLWLGEAIHEACTLASVRPQKIRFFRRAMRNMIAKACSDQGIEPLPSRRTFALNNWLQEREDNFYPQQPGYTSPGPRTGVRYPETDPNLLPEAVRGDRGDKWLYAALSAADLQEMPEWEIDFGEGFPVSLAALGEDTPIPGLIYYSRRALPLAAWMSGLELCGLSLQLNVPPNLVLDTGIEERWVVASLSSKDLVSETKTFMSAIAKSKGLHFLAIQESPEDEKFAGFWLLRRES
ncbi:MAG: Tab2/Atab2 family RNA-binding protein [Cyanobacteria bacterium P01_H01_bin.15]